MKCSVCGNASVLWEPNLQSTKCTDCGAKNSQVQDPPDDYQEFENNEAHDDQA